MVIKIYKKSNNNNNNSNNIHSKDDVLTFHDNFYTNYYFCVSYKCTTDSQCLYDKCVNNLCVFNENAPLTHCDDVYTRPGIFKKHAYNDKCTNDNECSSKLCYNNGLCSKQDKGPSDSENTVNIAIINYGTFF
ncbi:hypothetical protein H8356DRAFT_1284815 [Neocallimastix lanati (nom. inval.)]|nr:hypothetical protein H8356DRAFT_1284815 [Neocallimastix sp. JGI-2020a]